MAGRVVTPRGGGRGRYGRYVWLRGAAVRGGGGDLIRALRGGSIQKPSRGQYSGGFHSRGRGGGRGKGRW